MPTSQMGKDLRSIAEGIKDLSKRLRKVETDGKTLSSVMGSFMTLPGLRGLWPMSSFDADGWAYDVSGQGRHLYYVGGASRLYRTISSKTPCARLENGVYFTRPSEPSLEITGTETLIISGNRGITVGGWMILDTENTNQEVFISKANGGSTPNISFWLSKYSDKTARFVVSSGAAIDDVRSIGTISADLWHFVVGRWYPGGYAMVTLDGVHTLKASVVGSLNNLTDAPFHLGTYNGTTAQLDGYISMCFISGMYLADVVIDELYQTSRRLYQT